MCPSSCMLTPDPHTTGLFKISPCTIYPICSHLTRWQDENQTNRQVSRSRQVLPRQRGGSLGTPSDWRWIRMVPLHSTTSISLRKCLSLIVSHHLGVFLQCCNWSYQQVNMEVMMIPATLIPLELVIRMSMHRCWAVLNLYWSILSTKGSQLCPLRAQRTGMLRL
jgi:hypothetical protein